MITIKYNAAEDCAKCMFKQYSELNTQLTQLIQIKQLLMNQSASEDMINELSLIISRLTENLNQIQKMQRAVVRIIETYRYSENKIQNLYEGINKTGSRVCNNDIGYISSLMSDIAFE